MNCEFKKNRIVRIWVNRVEEVVIQAKMEDQLYVVYLDFPHKIFDFYSYIKVLFIHFLYSNNFFLELWIESRWKCLEKSSKGRCKITKWASIRQPKTAASQFYWFGRLWTTAWRKSTTQSQFRYNFYSNMLLIQKSVF